MFNLRMFTLFIAEKYAYLRLLCHALPISLRKKPTVLQSNTVFTSDDIILHVLKAISCGHTTDIYLGKTDLPRANSSKISRGKFISGFVLPG